MLNHLTIICQLTYVICVYPSISLHSEDRKYSDYHLPGHSFKKETRVRATETFLLRKVPDYRSHDPHE